MHSQQPSANASKLAAKVSDSQLHTIVLPSYTPEIAMGPYVEVYHKNCLFCHTARYVSMQPGLSKAVWQKEVKKMVDVYGAPISEADQVLIVEYLVAVNSADRPHIPTAPAK